VKLTNIILSVSKPTSNVTKDKTITVRKEITNFEEDDTKCTLLRKVYRVIYLNDGHRHKR
jgi:hypothetical protein